MMRQFSLAVAIFIHCISISMSQNNDYTMKMVGCKGEDASYSGRLEIFYQSYWGNICGDKFDQNAARVACYSLGYSRERAVHLYNSYGAQSNRTIILGGLECTGEERHLDYCTHPHYGVGLEACTHNQDVYVACEPNLDSDGEPFPGYEVRICNETGDICEYDPRVMFGRLEVKYDNTWGTVCAFRFDEIIYPPFVPQPTMNQAAALGCRNSLRILVEDGLDITGGFHSKGTLPATTERPIWLGWVTCGGWELNLGHCAHGAWGVHTCNHLDDVVVQCYVRTKEGRLLSGEEVEEAVERAKINRQMKRNKQKSM